MASTFTGDPPARRRGWLGRGAKLAAGFAISALFLYATISAVPGDKLLAAIASADRNWLLVALAFIGVDYAVKVWRWQTMLRGLGARVSFATAAVPFMGCVALNNVLPFRAGDVLRVVAFQKVTNLPTSAQLSTVLLERLLDLLVLVGLLFATITIWRVDVLPAPLLHGIEVASAAIVAALAIFFTAPGTVGWLSRWAEVRWPVLRPLTGALLRLSQAISHLSAPSLLARLFAQSVAAWLLEGGAFLACGYALGFAQKPEAALLALSVGTLSTIIPSSPGYVGTFHYFTAMTVAAFGIGEAESTAYAVVIHGLLWVSTTGCGLLLLATRGLGVALRSASARRASLQTEQGS